MARQGRGFMIWKRTLFFLVLMVFVCSCAQAKKVQVCPLFSESDYMKLAYKRSLQAKEASDLREQGRYAREGIDYANLCLKKNLNAVGCVYYRAVNRGLELETRTVRVRKELKKMVGDFKTVLKLNDQYDNGGAYLAMGYVYLKAPALPVMGKGIKRDLDLAVEYVGKALAIAPRDPSNLKLAGEIAYKKKDYERALGYFKQALKYAKSGALIENPKLKASLKKMVKKTKKKIQRRS